MPQNTFGWRWLLITPEVAAFSLKKITIKKKFQNRSNGFELRNHRKAPKKYFEIFHVTHQFLGNLMLNSILKSDLWKIKK